MTEPTVLFWDDVCVNPHQIFLEEGQQEGQKAGAEAGYGDGYETGRNMAIEYGMEVGFIKGVLNALKKAPNDSLMSEKAQTTMHNLLSMVDAFPNPDAVFHDSEQATTDEHSSDNEEDDLDDVREQLQRIKDRFKLLTVQLGLPHLSLKQVMDEAASDAKGSQGVSKIIETSW
jgi:hypothetical protein